MAFLDFISNRPNKKGKKNKSKSRVDKYNQTNIIQYYYPKAFKTDLNTDFSMVARGEYDKNYPEGAVVHYTAGNDNVDSVIKIAKEKGYMFFIIDRDAKVHQYFPLYNWGWHCGTSTWGDYKGRSLNDDFVGIEVMSAGLVSEDNGKFKTWFGKELKKEDVRYSEGEDNIQEGYYHKYTEDQEKALEDLLGWLYTNGQGIFKIKNIVGHDECCTPEGRKQDPGASLSMTMPELRTLIKNIT